jgi:ketosteroid isomerase-like protein
MGVVAEIAKRGYEAFNSGDVETLAAELDPAFEWHEAEEIPGPKLLRSREEFARYVGGFNTLWERFRFEPLELIESGDKLYVKLRAHARGRASQIDVELIVHHVWQRRNDLFTRMDAYLDEATARAAASLPPPG